MKIQGAEIKIKLNSKILELAGYRFVPNHTYAKIKFDENWISNSNFFGSQFPRYHIVKNEGRYFLHRDDKREHSFSDGITFSGMIIEREINRLREIKKKYEDS